MRFLTLAVSIAVVAIALLGTAQPTSIYDFTLNRIDGTTQSLGEYRGKVVMLVNVASKCGYTPQYEGLEALYERYKDRGLVVLGFPATDFAGQEPGSNEAIAEFCRATWSIRFPMFEKIHVRGEQKHPLYTWLTAQPAPLGGEIEWNFQKFIVSRDGIIVERLAPSTEPEDPGVIATIEGLLATPAEG
jgi:glutathione peroxidase